uniref:Uncharacterized protein n=1 Tax=Apteryx owenii TaxID=8824 RepID=A0A8B9PKX4_APTOW
SISSNQHAGLVRLHHFNQYCLISPMPRVEVNICINVPYSPAPCPSRGQCWVEKSGIAEARQGDPLPATLASPCTMRHQREGCPFLLMPARGVNVSFWPRPKPRPAFIHKIDSNVSIFLGQSKGHPRNLEIKK